MSEEILSQEFSPEELKKTASILSNLIIEEKIQFSLSITTSLINIETQTDTLPIISLSEIELDLLASCVGTILDPLGQLRDWFTSLINSISSWIVSAIQTFIDEYITPLVRTASNFITVTVPAIAKDLLTFFTEDIPAWLSDVTDFFTKDIPKWFSDVTDFFTKTIPDFFSKVIDFFTKTIPNLFSTVINFFTETIPSLFKTVIDFFTKTVPNLFDVVIDFFTEKLPNLLAIIIDFFTETLPNMFTGVITFFTETIPSLFKGVIDFFTITMPSLFDGIIKFFTKTLPDLFKGVIAFFTEILPDLFSKMVKGLTDFIDTLLRLPDKVPEIYTSIISGAYTKIIEPIFTTISEQIIEPFKKAIDEIVGNISAGFTELGKAIMGFVNAIMNFPQWFPIWFKEALVTPLLEGFKQWLIEPLVEALIVEIPRKSSSAYYMIYDIYVWKGIPIFPNIELLTHPIKWTSMYVIEATKIEEFSQSEGFIKSLIDAMNGVVKAIMDIISTFVSLFWKLAFSLVSPLVESTIEVFKSIPIEIEEAKEKLTDPLTSLFETAVQPIEGDLKDQVNTAMYNLLEKEIETAGVEELPYFKKKTVKGTLLKGLGYASLLTFLPVLAQLPMRLPQWVLKGVARTVWGLGWTQHISLKPFGIGYETDFDWSKALAGWLSTLADQLGDWINDYIRGIIYGYAIWTSRPIGRLVNYFLRNIVPVTFPREDTLIDIVRRYMKYSIIIDPATGKISEIAPIDPYDNLLKLARFYMALTGQSDITLDMLFDYKPETWIPIKDRFGRWRPLPLTLVHRLPTASEMCRMMVRDIFYGLKDFTKAIGTQGIVPDIAYLYYLLHFRYPPPERLWTFISRGISGMLWTTITPEERTELEAIAKELGAFMPKAPIDLNFEYVKLFDALKRYMKWHDYTRFSWIDGFTSDNLMMIDTLADMPTKIDHRWIMKWGLYHILAEKGVAIESPISMFRTELMEASATSKIEFDLILFSRALQATGLHPDWVPLTAVAESINALIDERTLLRTGFIALFKEGFWDLSALETLLKGFVQVSFHVSYFDIAENMWKDGWVNYPVMFLPAERRLLELRALMDRSLDILREIQRDISRGYQEWIIETYDEYKENLTKVIAKINVFFAEDYKSITDMELPDELKLSFVEAYYKPYVEALDIWRDIYTIRRVRYWTQRWLGWIMYRVATGVVKKEDIEKLINYVKEKAKLTDYEHEFIHQVMELMYEMAVREYIPTPSMLATLSEYLVISQELIEKTLEERLVPEEWKPIWKQYISIRPIADDVKGLLTSYRRALLYITLPEDIETRVKEYAELIGFTDRELNILALRTQLEELILEARESRREYIPTPSMLATIVEYIPRAREFFDDVVKARRIPDKWVPIWADYIDLRPIMSEVRKMISRAEDLYVYFFITEEDYKKILDTLKDFGYTQKELELMLTTSRYERHLRAFRELIGDVNRMTMLAEYSPTARGLALDQLNKMIDALPIDTETKNLLKTMWEQFIRLRPVIDEVRRYITELLADFAEEVITEEEFVSELEALKEWGLDDYEIMFYKAIGGLRRARYLRRRERES